MAEVRSEGVSPEGQLNVASRLNLLILDPGHDRSRVISLLIDVGGLTRENAERLMKKTPCSAGVPESLAQKLRDELTEAGADVELEEPHFEAAFSIALHLSSGLRRYPMIDPNGTVKIKDGRLTLRGDTGEIIAEAPLSDVRAYTIHRGKAVDAQIGEKTYHLGPLLQEQRLPVLFGVGAGVNASREFKRLRRGKQDARSFMQVFEAAGGRVGEP